MVARHLWRTADMAFVLSAGAAVSLALVGCASPSSSASPVGGWGPTASSSPSLTLEESGQFSGTDGCNRLTGSWSQHDHTVQFSQVAATMMACIDVDTWLSGLDHAEVHGDELQVFNSDDSVMGTLAKQ
ncbi:MAG: META domain-containing protein [Pseudoclavibacter sp.]